MAGAESGLLGAASGLLSAPSITGGDGLAKAGAESGGVTFASGDFTVGGLKTKDLMLVGGALLVAWLILRK